jgi:hypothetical protein
MEIFIKISLKLAADLASWQEGHHFGGLGGFVEADHFLVEFLPPHGQDADDVLAGLEEESVHQEVAL